MSEKSEITTRVLGIGGSPRKKGNSDVILKEILQGVRETGVPAKPVHLRDLLYQPCVGCEKCRKDKTCTGLTDGMTTLYGDILKSRGMVLVSPTHNYNVTAWMKAFIDRLYCFYDYTDESPRRWNSRLAGEGRKAVIAAVCEQVTKKDMGFTLEAMRLPLEALGYDVVDELAVFGVFHRGKVRDRQDVMTEARAMGRKLAWTL